MHYYWALYLQQKKVFWAKKLSKEIFAIALSVHCTLYRTHAWQWWTVIMNIWRMTRPMWPLWWWWYWDRCDWQSICHAINKSWSKALWWHRPGKLHRQLQAIIKMIMTFWWYLWRQYLGKNQGPTLGNVLNNWQLPTAVSKSIHLRQQNLTTSIITITTSITIAIKSRNLSYKAILGHHWISSYCRDADLVVKSDDDFFVDLPMLRLHQLLKIRTISNIFINCPFKRAGIGSGPQWLPAGLSCVGLGNHASVEGARGWWVLKLLVTNDQYCFCVLLGMWTCGHAKNHQRRFYLVQITVTYTHPNIFIGCCRQVENRGGFAAEEHDSNAQTQWNWILPCILCRSQPWFSTRPSFTRCLLCDQPSDL